MALGGSVSDVGLLGILPLQHHEASFKPEHRTILWGCRVKKEGDPDKVTELVDGTYGDVLCASIWRQAEGKEGRPMPGWAFAWPAIVSGARADPGAGGTCAEKDARRKGNTAPRSKPSGSPELLPARTLGQPDDRFEKKNPENLQPKWAARLPKGWPGVALAGTEDRAQADVFLPGFFGVVAPDRYGNKDHATRFFDETKQGEVDSDRWAGAHSLFAVMPGGGRCGPGRQLGLQLGKPNLDPTIMGGIAVMDHDVCAVGSMKSPHGPFLLDTAHENGACIHPGGKDADGNKVRPFHSDGNTHFFLAGPGDGPFEFDGVPWQPVDGDPKDGFWQRVYCRWNTEKSHPWCGGPIPGRWEWQVKLELYDPPPPQPPPRLPPPEEGPDDDFKPEPPEPIPPTPPDPPGTFGGRPITGGSGGGPPGAGGVLVGTGSPGGPKTLPPIDELIPGFYGPFGTPKPATPRPVTGGTDDGGGPAPQPGVPTGARPVPTGGSGPPSGTPAPPATPATPVPWGEIPVPYGDGSEAKATTPKVCDDARYEKAYPHTPRVIQAGGFGLKTANWGLGEPDLSGSRVISKADARAWEKLPYAGQLTGASKNNGDGRRGGFVSASAPANHRFSRADSSILVHPYGVKTRDLLTNPTAAAAAVGVSVGLLFPFGMSWLGFGEFHPTTGGLASGVKLGQATSGSAVKAQWVTGTGIGEDTTDLISLTADGVQIGTLNVTGKLTVGGLIDPTGLVLTRVGAAPHSGAGGTFWVGTSDRHPTWSSGTDSDNTAYRVALAQIASGDFTVFGGTGSGDVLGLRSTTHATPGHVRIRETSADTAAVREVLRVAHQSTGTIADGFGVRQTFALGTTLVGHVQALYAGATTQSDLVWANMRSSTVAERMRLTSDNYLRLAGGALELTSVSAPGAPGSGLGRLYNNSGVLEWHPNGGSVTALGPGAVTPIYRETEQVCNTGATESELMAYTVPGSTLEDDDELLHVVASGTFQQDIVTDTRVLRFYVDDHEVFEWVGTSATNDQHWHADLWVVRRTAFMGASGGAFGVFGLLTVGGSVTHVRVYDQDLPTATDWDDADGIVVKFTGQYTGGTLNCCIVQDLLVIDKHAD